MELSLMQRLEKIVELVNEFLSGVVVIMAAIAAHDNRVDFDMEEVLEIALPETAIPEAVVVDRGDR